MTLNNVTSLADALRYAISQPEISISTTVTTGDNNPVTSDAVQTAITSAIDALNLESSGVNQGELTTATTQLNASIAGNTTLINDAVARINNLEQVIVQAIATASSSFRDKTTYYLYVLGESQSNYSVSITPANPIEGDAMVEGLSMSGIIGCLYVDNGVFQLTIDISNPEIYLREFSNGAVVHANTLSTQIDNFLVAMYKDGLGGNTGDTYVDVGLIDQSESLVAGSYDNLVLYNGVNDLFQYGQFPLYTQTGDILKVVEVVELGNDGGGMIYRLQLNGALTSNVSIFQLAHFNNISAVKIVHPFGILSADLNTIRLGPKIYEVT